MTQPLRTFFAGKTDVGLLRDRNEDSFLVFPEYRFAAVADGMGGHLSGDIASSLAIQTLQDFYSHTVGPDRTWPFPYDNDLTEEENCVVVGVRLANQHVFSRARRSQNESGMGTTIVAVMFTRDLRQVIVGHVGDSRCYRLRDGQITQLTSDHSLVSEVTEIAPWLSEEEVNQLPSNVITRALGMAPDVVVDLLTTEARPGDTYLLCSDGLNGMLTDEEISSICTESDDLDAVCDELISRANAAGGNDNTTVVMVRVESDGDDDEASDSDEAPDSDEGSSEPPDSSEGSDEAPDSDDGSSEPPDSDEGSDEAPDSDEGSSEPPDSDEGSSEPPDSDEGDSDAGESDEAPDSGADDDEIVSEDTKDDGDSDPDAVTRKQKAKRPTGVQPPFSGGAIELIEEQGGLAALLGEDD